MATEGGAIITFFPPNQAVLDYCQSVSKQEFTPVYADPDAIYEKTIEINIAQLKPMIAKPGHPEDVIPVAEIAGKKIDSAFIGSCTNGRLEDMRITANLLKGRRVAAGVVLKIVPSTDEIWQQCLKEGLIEIFKEAGALVGNAGCAGCAAGQIGQNGPGEVTLSTGNRNFAGKQGKGEVCLASPATVAASAISGVITTADNIYPQPVMFPKVVASPTNSQPTAIHSQKNTGKPIEFSGRVWVIPIDNIDTDMIFHNRYLTITDIKEMGQYTFDNLANYTDFAKKVKPGDILVTGKNFGAGSSRQQAVDCFESLGVSLIIAESFGAIYERNAINKGFPIMKADLLASGLKSGDAVTVNIAQGTIQMPDQSLLNGQPFSPVQLEIYHQGGYLMRPQS
jgi:3-isopropylmalate dehydratase small subunit